MLRMLVLLKYQKKRLSKGAKGYEEKQKDYY